MKTAKNSALTKRFSAPWLVAGIFSVLFFLPGCNSDETAQRESEDTASDNSENAFDENGNEPLKSPSREETVEAKKPLTNDDVRDEISAIELPASPTEEKPVVTAARYIVDPSDASRALIAVRIDIMPGWHIYGSLPEGSPFELTQVNLQLPEGVSTDGQWDKPAAMPKLDEPHLGVWKGNLVLVQAVKLSDSATDLSGSSAELVYQACNQDFCLPPTTVEIQLDSLP